MVERKDRKDLRRLDRDRSGRSDRARNIRSILRTKSISERIGLPWRTFRNMRVKHTLLPRTNVAVLMAVLAVVVGGGRW